MVSMFAWVTSLQFIPADQTETEEETDGKDSSQVDFAGHLDSLPSINQSRGSAQ